VCVCCSNRHSPSSAAAAAADHDDADAVPDWVAYIIQSLVGTVPAGTWLDQYAGDWNQVGAIFYRDAYYSLRNRAPDISVLIVIGTTTAYIASMVGILVPFREQYFETAAVLITFVVLGKHLEVKAKVILALSVLLLVS
jgi:cation transport ATPase